ncbi:cbb3-type cytochrome oxidase assembly protein CcoS [Parasphingorhabdus cellanae]|uniref:Cbb3-type cytochrome oxidase assembly protein CcoS n=1 Tax=Parasphingorhabdus cellanae TaxID=2806553 RepID=A0ABX7T5W7_9SPHN|nr:cbb3-type cytochrome oxidase assembly protein CcoS [Parasphingorhabdus cellanae]QTD56994.1 cbb3-type cytochrome oxidase assembly protein CcoS [Parasphingorhabdus cellanae]
MSGLAILIPVALLMGLAGLAFFFWAMRNGQFEDLDGAAQRVLIDDDAPNQDKSADDSEGRGKRKNG